MPAPFRDGIAFKPRKLTPQQVRGDSKGRVRF